MLSLQKHHITDLYCLVDDILPKEKTSDVGRPALLTNSEMICILIWSSLISRNKSLKDIYRHLKIYHRKDFPKMPRYSGFVMHCHRIIPHLLLVLSKLLNTGSPLRFMDSTMIEVCKIQRAESHKTASGVAKFGKNHQGWYYGFKLHASIDKEGNLCGLTITPANIYDAQMMPKILNKLTEIAVGDQGYGASVMREHIFKKYGTIVIAPPHFKQKTKLMTWFQQKLLEFRPKIESVFNYLKEHLNLVSSFPRSVKGYLLHYVRILLGYQVEKIFT